MMWFLKRLLLFGVALITPFFLLEGFLQLKEIRRDYRVAQVQQRAPQDVFTFFEYDPLLGWKNRPHAQGTFQTHEATTWVAINAKGLRGKEYPYERSEKPRVLVLGDSFVWGYGVQEKDRFTERLEARLNGEIEVINAGVPGYGPDQMFLFFDTEGKRYRPDMVIVALNYADLFDLFLRVNHTYPKPYFIVKKGVLHLQGVPVPRRPSSGEERKAIRLPPRTRVGMTPYPETNPFLAFLEKQTLLYPKLKNIFQWGTHDPKGEERFIRLLFEAFQKNCKELEAELLFLTVPLSGEVSSGARSPLYLELSELLEEWGYAVTDPFERLQMSNRKERLYFERDDGHWTSAGHGAIAETLEETLRETLLINREDK